MLVMTDRYPNVTGAVTTSKTTTADIASICTEHWTTPYRIPDYVRTDNGTQSVSKLFESVCAFLGTKHLTTTGYHSQRNGQVGIFNYTIIKRPRHYMAEHPRNWDIYVHLLTDAYSMQARHSTNLPLFSLILSRQPSGPTTLHNLTTWLTNATVTTSRHVLWARLLQ